MIDIDKYKTIARNLKTVSEQFNDKKYYTGDVRIDYMASDASDAINDLIFFIEEGYSKESIALNEFCEFMSRK